jgi:hypothetical protein
MFLIVLPYQRQEMGQLSWVMSYADITKWISGETEIFFNPGRISPLKRSTFGKLAQPLIAIVVLALCFLTVAISQLVELPAVHSADETANVASAPLPPQPGPLPDLTQRATAFINSYWQSVEDRGDRVFTVSGFNIRSPGDILRQITPETDCPAGQISLPECPNLNRIGCTMRPPIS